MIALQDTDIHLRRRRPWQRAFTPQTLKSYEDQIGARAGQIIAALEREAHGPIALDQYMERFS